MPCSHLPWMGLSSDSEAQGLEEFTVEVRWQPGEKEGRSVIDTQRDAGGGHKNELKLYTYQLPTMDVIIAHFKYIPIKS